MEAEEKKTKKKELQTTDLKIESKKVKVIFMQNTTRAGEVAEIDRALAYTLQEKKKVSIIKTEENEHL